MKSIVYVGMDVHKNLFSLCAYDNTTGEYVSEFDVLSNKIDRSKLRIEELSEGERYKELIAKLRCFKGIDTFSAMTIHVEIA